MSDTVHIDLDYTAGLYTFKRVSEPGETTAEVPKHLADALDAAMGGFFAAQKILLEIDNEVRSSERVWYWDGDLMIGVWRPASALPGLTGTESVQSLAVRIGIRYVVTVGKKRPSWCR